MNVPIAELSIFFAGILIGCVHCVGFAFSNRLFRDVAKPLTWLLMAFVARMAISVYLFYWVYRWFQWRGVVGAGIGFFLVRLLVGSERKSVLRQLLTPPASGKDLLKKK